MSAGPLGGLLGWIWGLWCMLEQLRGNEGEWWPCTDEHEMVAPCVDAARADALLHGDSLGVWVVGDAHV